MHYYPSPYQKGLPKYVIQVRYKLITTDKFEQMLLAKSLCFWNWRTMLILAALLELDLSSIADEMDLLSISLHRRQTDIFRLIFFKLLLSSLIIAYLLYLFTLLLQEYKRHPQACNKYASHHLIGRKQQNYI